MKNCILIKCNINRTVIFSLFCFVILQTFQTVPRVQYESFRQSSPFPKPPKRTAFLAVSGLKRSSR